MKKLLFSLITMCFYISAEARPYPDEVGICYEFKHKKLSQKSLCIISHGYGAGSSYTNIQIANEDYFFETNTMTEETFYKDESVEHYLRHNGFYHKISEVDSSNEHIYCYKSASIDLCHN